MLRSSVRPHNRPLHVQPNVRFCTHIYTANMANDSVPKLLVNSTIHTGATLPLKVVVISGVARIWCQGARRSGAEGASIEVPKAPTGWTWKGVSASQPTRGSGERRELPSRVRGEAPAAIAFYAYFTPQNGSGSKKIRFCCPK